MLPTRAGGKISLPAGDLSELKISESGELTLNGTSCGKLNIAVFPNNDGLLAVGNSCFQETQASGQAQTKENTVVNQGFLEGSNVDLVTEMTQMIRGAEGIRVCCHRA